MGNRRCPKDALNLQMPENLERVAGIEPAYSAWKTVKTVNKINKKIH